MPDGSFEVHGAFVERIHSSAGLTSMIERATARRTTSSNNIHLHSSRSHAFLTLHLERRAIERGVEFSQVPRALPHLLALIFTLIFGCTFLLGFLLGVFAGSA